MKPELETRQMLSHMGDQMVQLMKEDKENQLPVVTGFIEALKWVLEVESTQDGK